MHLAILGACVGRLKEFCSPVGESSKVQISPLGPLGPQTSVQRSPTTSSGGPQDSFEAGRPSLLGTAKALLRPEGSERWRVKLPFSLSNRPSADPQGGLFASAGDGTLRRFDPETGKALWTFKHEGGAGHMTDPAFTEDGKVLVVADMRRVFVLDRETGQTEHEVALDLSTLSPPASGPNGTLVLFGGDGMFDKDWSIYAVDPKVKPKKRLMDRLLAPIALIPRHGTMHQWEVKVNSQPGMLAIPMTPRGDLHRLVNLPNGLISATTGDSEVIAVNPADGQPAWRRELPGQGFYDPVPVGEDQVMVARSERLFFLDARSGETLREQPVDNVLFSQPTSDGAGNVFFFTGLDKLHVLRPDGRSWTAQGKFETRYSPVEDAHGNLFVVKEGALYSLNAETGEENFRLTCPGEVRSAPALLADGSLAIKVGSSQREDLVALQNPIQAAMGQEDQGAAVQESVAWVRIGGVQVKRRG